MNLSKTVLVVFSAAIGSAQIPQSDPAPFALSITGDVQTPIIISSTELAAMHRETASFADHDGTMASYEGISLQSILIRAGVLGKDLHGKILATYILAKARDGYEVLFAIGELDPKLGNEYVLIADKRDGKPLTGNQGPLRLICPSDKAGARSLRMLETLEVVSLKK